MAALAYVPGSITGSSRGMVWPERRASVVEGEHLQLLRQDAPIRSPKRTAVGDIRRFFPGILSLLVLVATYFAGGALVAAHAQAPSQLLGARHTSGGYTYVVQRGDTLWSIATRLEPSADPRPLVDELTAKLGSSAVYAGEHLTITLP